MCLNGGVHHMVYHYHIHVGPDPDFEEFWVVSSLEHSPVPFPLQTKYLPRNM
jgi:hypothetical protein